LKSLLFADRIRADRLQELQYFGNTLYSRASEMRIMKFSTLLHEIFTPWQSIRRIKRLEERAAIIDSRLMSLATDIQSATFLTGQVAARMLPKEVKSIQEAEFRVFSQFGEDGIIQFLTQRLSGRIDKSFVEFGVQHYLESNTLFLLMHSGWRGLVLDCDANYIEVIRGYGFDWKYGLRARCAMVSPDNINAILREEGFGSQLGLLSIDVDSVDWHLWNALTIVRPGIVVIEYNQCFPIDRPITIPYEENFSAKEKHYTGWYFGTSLPALTVLAKEKGYTFVGVESRKRNAFFVRDDLAIYVPNDVLREEYVIPDTKKTVEILRGMPVYNAATKTEEPI
jgi:hypothetical protein